MLLHNTKELSLWVRHKGRTVDTNSPALDPALYSRVCAVGSRWIYLKFLSAASLRLEFQAVKVVSPFVGQKSFFFRGSRMSLIGLVREDEVGT